MNTPLVSVLVPVYNVEKYLDECISSIVSQTYSNLDIILLPGSSTDSSTEICKKWVQLDPRIRIVEQDINCLGYARNKGIANAKGDYIAFCDSDDKISPTFIEKFLNTALKYSSDLVECEYYFASDDMKEFSIYDNLSLLKNFDHGFYERFGSSSVWKCFTKKELWTKNNIKFHLCNFMEDVSVYTILFHTAKRISYIHEPLYFYRQNPNSEMHTHNALEKQLKTFYEVAEWLKTEHIRLNLYGSTKNILISLLEHHAFYTLQRHLKDDEDLQIQYETIISDYLKKLFSISTTVFDICSLGWGSLGIGELCSLLTKNPYFKSTFIQGMSFRGLTTSNIKNQFIEKCIKINPNVILIDFVEEIPYLSAYPKELSEYLYQWEIGLSAFDEIIKKICPNSKVIIVERYLYIKRKVNNTLNNKENLDDLSVFNEFLAFLYKTAKSKYTNYIYIDSIPEHSRYSIDESTTGGNRYDGAYYYEKIIDELHKQ